METGLADFNKWITRYFNVSAYDVLMSGQLNRRVYSEKTGSAPSYTNEVEISPPEKNSLAWKSFSD